MSYDRRGDRPTGDQARRARAAKRRSSNLPGQVVKAGTAKPVLYSELSLVERFHHFAALCQSQWEASGRTIVHHKRDDMPGEVFRIRHGRDRTQ